MADIRGETDEQETMYKRSQFHMTANKQYAEGLKEKVADMFPGEWIEKYKEVSLKKVRDHIQTQLIEEINGCQKEQGRARHSSSDGRKPVIAWAQVLSSGLVSGKHRWEEIQADIPIKGKTSKIPVNTVEPLAAERSFTFQDIVPSTDSITWHSHRQTTLVPMLVTTSCWRIARVSMASSTTLTKCGRVGCWMPSMIW